MRSELRVYVGRIRLFSRRDWVAYLAWVATIFGLCAATSAFLLLGVHHGVSFPAPALLVPLGAGVFTIAIAIDTIGHRTIYRDAIAGGEALVHQITIGCGVASVVLLVLAYQHPVAVIPAAVLTGLSILYSLVDEAFHWRRYVRNGSDRVEIWSHVGILTGHITMMAAWWVWYGTGYEGVAATLGYL